MKTLSKNVYGAITYFCISFIGCAESSPSKEINFQDIQAPTTKLSSEQQAIYASHLQSIGRIEQVALRLAGLLESSQDPMIEMMTTNLKKQNCMAQFKRDLEDATYKIEIVKSKSCGAWVSLQIEPHSQKPEAWIFSYKAIVTDSELIKANDIFKIDLSGELETSPRNDLPFPERQIYQLGGLLESQAYGFIVSDFKVLSQFKREQKWGEHKTLFQLKYNQFTVAAHRYDHYDQGLSQSYSLNTEPISQDQYTSLLAPLRSLLAHVSW